MNVLLRLGKGLEKNGLTRSNLRAEIILPKQFLTKTRTSDEKKVLYKAQGVPRDVYVRNNEHLVGSGSNFARNMVQEYLSPLRAHPLKRHKVNNNYDQEKSKSFTRIYKHIKRKESEGTIGIGMSQQFLGDLLASLIANTPKDAPMKKREGIRKYYDKFTFDEVPPIPDFNKEPGKYETYIGMLTHTNFQHRNSSKSNGIVPKILRNLIHPGNIKTMHLRNVNVYNDLIYFFSEKFDFATCRELFVQMKTESISPNTSTYNLMLRSVLKNSHIRKEKSPDSEVLYYLKNMKAYSVSVDHITWTTCYNFLSNDISRDIYIEQMLTHNIQMTSKFLFTVFKNGNYSSSEQLDFMVKNSIPISSDLFDLSISKLLQEGRIKIAWAFMIYAIKKDDKDLKVNFQTINKFLRVFAEKGRIDLALLAFNTFTKEYVMKPDPHTMEMLFKALVNNGYSANFSTVLQYLKDIKQSYNFGRYKSYWVVKCDSIVEFNCKKQCTKESIQKANQLLNGFKWHSTEFPEQIWENNEVNNRKCLRFLGCTPRSFQNSSKGNNNKSIIASPDIVHKKLRYRNRIRSIAIQNSMASRIPYAKDWYGSLKSELSNRGIISDINKENSELK